MTETTIGSSQLSATIAARGAELIALQTNDGTQLLWNGDAKWWSGRSPPLFPIVGRLPGDKALIDGAIYDLPQHGFARASTFALRAADARSCTYELTSNPELLARYPRAFSLAVTYTVDGTALSIAATITNRDAKVMPFSFGFHPAFLWPLEPDTDKTGHTLVFSENETAPIQRPDDGLLSKHTQPNPVANGTLALDDALFAEGALIFTELRSRRIVYRGPGNLSLAVEFPGMPHLGVWTKPGAPFICIEPWQGYAAPVGFAGELATKPGIVLLPPATSATYAMTITVLR
jgi:galactose mutarotase-like enzyme